jgi:hypothetical protein
MSFKPFSKEWWFDTVLSCFVGYIYGWFIADLTQKLIGSSILSLIIVLVFCCASIGPLMAFVRDILPVWPYRRG